MHCLPALILAVHSPDPRIDQKSFRPSRQTIARSATQFLATPPKVSTVSNSQPAMSTPYKVVDISDPAKIKEFLEEEQRLERTDSIDD
jgi:hypothetical protein